MPSAPHAIVVEHLTKRYGSLLAVDDVSFTVNSGDVFAFLGPNGAGKSTTAEILETIRTPTSGVARVLGMDVTTSKRLLVPRIGVLPQDFRSFDRLTVRESLRYYGRLFGRRTDIDALMSLTNLADKADAPFKTLSGGLKQRMGIAAALVNDPEIVFLDEPTTGLDPHARREVWDVLKGLRSRGKTIYLTTHNMEEAEYLADMVAIMFKGRIVAIDTPSRLTETHTGSMRMRIPGGDVSSLELVQRLGFAATSTEGSLYAAIGSMQDVRRLLNAFHEAGLAIDGFEVQKPTLEEVFLKLTGQPLRDGDREART